MAETTPRFLTAELGVEHLLKQIPPLHFEGTSKTEWQEWRKNFRRKLIKDLGPKPEAIPLEVEVLERTEMDGYTREKIIFNPDPFSSIPAYVLSPEGQVRTIVVRRYSVHTGTGLERIRFPG